MDNHAIVVADTAGVIRLWSQGAEKLFGFRAEEAIGQKLDLIVAEPFREQHWHGFQQAMQSGTAKAEGQASDIPVKCSDGTVTAFRGLFVLLRNANNNVIGAMAIFTGPT
jgi:PAS domain S-box-containing protein